MDPALPWPEFVGLIVLIVLMIGVPALVLWRKLRGGLESGASLGRFDPPEAAAYGATIAHTGEPRNT